MHTAGRDNPAGSLFTPSGFRNPSRSDRSRPCGSYVCSVSYHPEQDSGRNQREHNLNRNRSGIRSHIFHTHFSLIEILLELGKSETGLSRSTR